MTEPAIPHGVVAYDLVAPTKNLWTAMMEAARTCPVCGRERPSEWEPVLSVFFSNRRYTDPHASCRRTIDGYDAQVRAIDDDPDYVAACDAVEAARAAAERVWRDRLAALDLPDWYVARVTAFREDPT